MEINGTVRRPALAPDGRSWQADLQASFVVFLVALPLCMGIAIASGVPVEKAAGAGILTGIVGGLIVGLISGSPLQVSGPAAGLSVLVLELTQKHGWEALGMVFLAAGAIQLAAGLFKLGQWFRAVSPAVIHGMLAGIGILIVVSQFHIMLDDRPKESGLKNILTLPEAAWKGIVPSEDVSHDEAARIGILTILVIVFWKAIAPKKLQMIPGPLLAIVCATLVTQIGKLDIVLVAVPDNLWQATTFVTLPDLEHMETLPGLLVAALSLAFIASAETLLCATAVDKLHSGQRTNYDRELAAQGVGNMICGAIGALPMTGVIVRSAANIEAGGRTRLSAILHGVLLLLFVCLFPVILRWIPTASLAAILVYTGYKLVNVQAIRSLWAYGTSEVLIYSATVLTIVFKDLLTGVLVGIGLSIVKLLYTFSHLRIRIQEDRTLGRTVLSLQGAATFLRLPKLASALEQVQPSTELHVQFENLSYIDHACLDLLISWEKQHQSTGGSLEIDWDSLHARFRRGKHDHAPTRRVSEAIVSPLLTHRVDEADSKG